MLKHCKYRKKIKKSTNVHFLASFLRAIKLKIEKEQKVQQEFIDKEAAKANTLSDKEVSEE